MLASTSRWNSWSKREWDHLRIDEVEAEMTAQRDIQEINTVHLTGHLVVYRLLRDGRQRPFMAIGVLDQGEERYPVALTKGALKHYLKTSHRTV